MNISTEKLKEHITKATLEDENQLSYHHHWLFYAEEEQSHQTNPRTLQIQSQPSTFHPLHGNTSVNIQYTTMTFRTSEYTSKLTNRSYFTFPIMVGILNILNNFQCFSPFLNRWIGAIKLEDFWLGIQNKNIIMVEWRSSKRNLWPI